ncbi:MAG: type IX secretion system membrane protein PorP/SprF [Flavobacteriales bacterium]|nr:type IX secretion system membrane protein PorP/SprF [Flavobacteriales bacterium]
MTIFRQGLTIALFLLTMQAMGQHSGVLSQYMFNGLVLNPAYAGSQNTLSVNVNYRNQWTGFEGAPVAQIASIHSPLKNSPLSAGFMATHEQSGVSSDIGFNAISSYELELDRGEMRFGIGAGVAIGSSRWSDVEIDQTDDPLFQQNSRGLIRPLFSAGVYYQTKEWYGGYSLPSVLSYSLINAEEIRTTFTFGNMEHLLTGGYVHKVNRQVVVKPSFLVRVLPNSGIQFDLNTNVVFKKKIWTGLSYRHLDAVVAMVEYQVHHQLRVGYAFDYSLHALGRYSLGSHEIALMWAFRQKSFARNPRYF